MSDVPVTDELLAAARQVVAQRDLSRETLWGGRQRLRPGRGTHTWTDGRKMPSVPLVAARARDAVEQLGAVVSVHTNHGVDALNAGRRRL
jgi:CBS-domain-containing membrane protein